MIDVRSVCLEEKKMSVVYFCANCEAEFGSRVERSVPLGRKEHTELMRTKWEEVEGFLDFHEKCGATKPTDQADDVAWIEKMIEDIYAVEFPDKPGWEVL